MPHADDLADDLHIEAITFRLSVDFSFGLVQFLDLLPLVLTSSPNPIVRRRLPQPCVRR
jgi:hypothetical protein